ncbi:YitT family protein [Pontibacillus yanchengensis]|uniref:YitT family protein n=2 Tax=Pontibacillus yanchengensis TaxID=462910 RepID=A0ACC7VDU0_9BACI|nr:YitT family protein [Pontibacillus yanchengensis]MYL34714.1 YitT family protein [Pontibacillus yanchengensis]MYL52300.1 YitT family protein [Pontibacillus yanchengensis]
MNRIYLRAMYYTFGIVILTLGIALTILSKLGTSPFDALLVGLYRTFGLTIGSWEIVVGFSMVVFNAIAEKRRPEIIALVTSFLTGIGIDIWIHVFDGWVEPSSLLTQILYLLLGMIVSALGIAINLQAEFAPNPFDRMMLVVKNLTGTTVSFSRALISLFLVILAAFFGGAIGFGTVLIAFLSGAIIHMFMNVIDSLDRKLSKYIPTIEH